MLGVELADHFLKRLCRSVLREYQRGGLAYRTEVVDLLPGIQTVNCERFAIELRSIHEEADIRVALQTGFCTRTGSYKTTPNVLVCLQDKVISITKLANRLPPSLDKVISITKLPDRLPPSIVNSIAFLHCFTGCDILSFIFFKEKQTILRAVLPWLPRISALAQMILEEIDRVVELEEDEAVFVNLVDKNVHAQKEGAIFCALVVGSAAIQTRNHCARLEMEGY
ncbi:hypothetical protein QYM36_018035 [Artemia franciscana]|uniref:Uncharacterized protein n=1 Tax=Artemia franciscana TaxID=6661 RepID=A0AA88H9R7_ARTSF|nr:hypothetical protein QYM36_018035 [Artemia franciscana]